MAREGRIGHERNMINYSRTAKYELDVNNVWLAKTRTEDTRKDSDEFDYSWVTDEPEGGFAKVLVDIDIVKNMLNNVPKECKKIYIKVPNEYGSLKLSTPLREFEAYVSPMVPTYANAPEEKW